MIEWKEFNGQTAPLEIDEDCFLIIVKERIVQAYHDAMERNFYWQTEDFTFVYSYRDISHYAEFNWPEYSHDNNR